MKTFLIVIGAVNLTYAAVTVAFIAKQPRCDHSLAFIAGTALGLGFACMVTGVFLKKESE